MQRVYRRLGATEHAVWLRDRAAPLHFALTAQIQGTIEVQALFNALNSLQRRHPLLRAKIVPDHKGIPYFIEQTAPIACRVVLRLGDTHWQTEVIQELTQQFDSSNAPLIRVVLVQSPAISELIVVCHHAIADGLAGANLIREILRLLEHSRQDIPDQSIPPSLESVLPHYQPASTLQKLLAFGVLNGQQLKQRMNLNLSDGLPSSAPFQIECGCLSSATTTQLIERCRQQSTTVHAAICAAWLFAIALHQPCDQKLRCFSPINLRPYLAGQLDQTCGLFIAPAQTSHAISVQTQFWPLARSLKATLMHHVETDPLLKLMRQHDVLVSTNVTPKFVHRLFTKNFASDMMVTNLGRLTIPQQYGHCFLKAIYGPMVLSGFERERVCGVATLGDRLSFTIIHPKSDVESKLATQAIQLLEHAISHPEMTRSSAENWLIERKETELLNV